MAAAQDVGELVQVDGSEHWWFEDRGPQCKPRRQSVSGLPWSIIPMALLAALRSREAARLRARAPRCDGPLRVAFRREAGIHFEVVRSEGMDEREVPARVSQAPVAARALAALKLRQRAVEPDVENVEAFQFLGKTVLLLRRLDDEVDDQIVARAGKGGEAAVVAVEHPGPHGRPGKWPLAVPPPRQHLATVQQKVEGEAEERHVEPVLQRSGERRFARARRAVQQDDRRRRELFHTSHPDRHSRAKGDGHFDSHNAAYLAHIRAVSPSRGGSEDMSMKKVAVFGNAGGGKSTLSRRLADITGLPLYVLDIIHFRDGIYRPDRKDGGKLSEQEYLSIHREILSQDEWIIDGYGSLPTVWERMSAADTLIYIDLPITAHYWGVTKRFAAGLFRNPKGWPENSPMWESTLDSYRVIWRCHRGLTPRYRQRVAEAASSKQVHHLTSRTAMTAFLQGAAKRGGRPDRIAE